MPFNPLAPVTDYQSMLNRIFWFTTATAFAAVWLLRAQVPALDVVLGRIDFASTLVGGKGAPTLGGCLLPALVVGVAARVFGLHERISDWLEIREDFDVEVIIAELADHRPATSRLDPPRGRGLPPRRLRPMPPVRSSASALDPG
jgi:hypothetical protein